MALAIKSTGVMTAPATLGYLSDRLFAGMAAGYSVRQLSGSYGGPLLRGRRTATGAEHDFTEGELYDGSLASFAAGSDVTVSTWYNQAGGSPLTTAQVSRQPRIVAAGAPLIKKGRLYVQFDGVDDYLGGVLNAPQPFQLFATGVSAPQAFAYIFEARDPSVPNGQAGKSVALLTNIAGAGEAFYAGTDMIGGSSVPAGDQFSYAASATGGAGTLKNNRGGSYAGPCGGNGLGTLIVGASESFSSFTSVGVQELIAFPEILSDLRESEIFTAAQDYFGASQVPS